MARESAQFLHQIGELTPDRCIESRPELGYACKLVAKRSAKSASRPLGDLVDFTGRQAKEARLVDELGDLDDAIHLAADIVGIEGEPKVLEPRRRFSVRELLESRLPSFFPKLDLQSGVSLKYLMAF